MWWHKAHKVPWFFWPLGWLVISTLFKGVAFVGQNPVILAIAVLLAVPFLSLGAGMQLVKNLQSQNSGPLKRKNDEWFEKRKHEDDEAPEPRRFVRTDDGEFIEVA